MVDINNTKQNDKKETTEMGIRTNYSIASKPKYREVKRKLCQSIYTEIKLLSNSAAEVEDYSLRTLKKKRQYRTIDHDHLTVFSNFMLCKRTLGARNVSTQIINNICDSQLPETSRRDAVYLTT